MKTSITFAFFYISCGIFAQDSCFFDLYSENKEKEEKELKLILDDPTLKKHYTLLDYKIDYTFDSAKIYGDDYPLVKKLYVHVEITSIAGKTIFSKVYEENLLHRKPFDLYISSVQYYEYTHPIIDFGEICLNLLENFTNDQLDTILSSPAGSLYLGLAAMIKSGYEEYQELISYWAKTDYRVDGFMRTICSYEGYSYAVRQAAIQKLNAVKYQDVLIDIALNDDNDKIRMEAVYRLDNKKVLSKITKEDISYEVRQAAIMRKKELKKTHNK